MGRARRVVRAILPVGLAPVIVAAAVTVVVRVIPTV